jgi:DNA-binding protein YbaB
MTERPDHHDAIDELRRTAEQVRVSLSSIRGSGTAANGSVTVTVDSSGRLRDIEFADSAFARRDQLPRLVLEATAAAEVHAAEQASVAMEPLTSDTRVGPALAEFQEAFPMHDLDTQTTSEAVDDDSDFQQVDNAGWKT